MNALTAEVGLIHGSGFEVAEGIYVMSAATRHHAEKAAELLSTNVVDSVICSGRGPLQDEDYEVTEAQLMADYLVREGISARRIEIENTSTSTIGNWANSAPIIQGLEATTVLGVCAPASVKRMHIIGDFVAAKSGFTVVGYSPSSGKSSPKDYLREAASRTITHRFLSVNTQTPIDQLSETYEIYKSEHGLDALKKLTHRCVVAPKTV